jgi:hypothetical protein
MRGRAKSQPGRHRLHHLRPPLHVQPLLGGSAQRRRHCLPADCPLLPQHPDCPSLVHLIDCPLLKHLAVCLLLQPPADAHQLFRLLAVPST